MNRLVVLMLCIAASICWAEKQNTGGSADTDAITVALASNDKDLDTRTFGQRYPYLYGYSSYPSSYNYRPNYASAYSYPTSAYYNAYGGTYNGNSGYGGYGNTNYAYGNGYNGYYGSNRPSYSAYANSYSNQPLYDYNSYGNTGYGSYNGYGTGYGGYALGYRDGSSQQDATGAVAIEPINKQSSFDLRSTSPVAA